MAKETLPNVLLLSTSQSLSTMDKRILRDCGVPQTAILSSGEAAAKFLADHCDLAHSLIVVVNEVLEDMTGEQFCSLVRLHPLLLAIPILLVLKSASERDQLLTLGCGASELIARPFSTDDMRAVLLSLRRSMVSGDIEKARQNVDARAFDAALLTFQTILRPRQRSPEDYYKAGMQCLSLQKWNSAITAFRHAMASQVLRGEAELGCAAAWRGKGNIQEAQEWLARAAETFVAAKKWHNARSVYARLLLLDDKAKNPFFLQARRLINQGELDSAAETLSEGFETTPKPEACRRMAKICASATDPEEMLDLLKGALERRPIVNFSELVKELPREVEANITEQKAWEREAQEKRRADLSRRLNIPLTPLKDEEPEEQSRKRTVPSVRQDEPGDVEFGMGRRPAVQRRFSEKQRDLEERVVAVPGLLSLPGDAVDTGSLSVDPVQPLDLPGTSSGSVSRLRDLLHVAKLTWKLSKRN